MTNTLTRERLDDRYFVDRAIADDHKQPMCKRLMAKIRDEKWLRRREQRIRKIGRRVQRVIE